MNTLAHAVWSLAAMICGKDGKTIPSTGMGRMAEA
jgi:hypothetical protein